MSNLLKIVSPLPEFANPSKAEIWVFKDMAKTDLKSKNQKQRSVMAMFNLIQVYYSILIIIVFIDNLYHSKDCRKKINKTIIFDTGCLAFS